MHLLDFPFNKYFPFKKQITEETLHYSGLTIWWQFKKESNITGYFLLLHDPCVKLRDLFSSLHFFQA